MVPPGWSFVPMGEFSPSACHPEQAPTPMRFCSSNHCSEEQIGISGRQVPCPGGATDR